MNAPVPQWQTLEANPCVGPMREGSRRFWTGREELLLREHYPKGGVGACLPHLPGRTAKAIYQRAGSLGLHSPRTENAPPRQSYSTSEPIDAAIRRVYQRAPTKGDIQKLAVTLQRPAWWVSKRAAVLGLALPRFRPDRWADAEILIVREREGQAPERIKRALAKAGFSRSLTAVAVQMKRLGVSRVSDDPDLYNATMLGELFGVDSQMVAAWVDKGWLKAKKDPGVTGKYRIKRQDVRRFVIDNVAAVDIRKVDKWWLVDLLAGANP